MEKGNFAFAVHGGAGNIQQEELGEYKIKIYEEALTEVGKITQEFLSKGATALDAVMKAVMFMEDCPLFNAGRGAVFNSDGIQEMDASIMDGKAMNAGAIAGVHHIKNPITAARMVMEKSPHVMIIGESAEKFVSKNGMALVEKSYFFDSFRKKQQEQAKIEGRITLDHDIHIEDKDKHGTVGAVALDKYGNLAAATSTGGTTNKMPGRVGDCPIIGAGTYANDFVAISCTGHGEPFIKYAAAHEVVALMKYKNLSLQEATELLINQRFKEIKADGGLISVDKNGDISLPFNTTGMFRAFGNENVVKIGIA